MAKTLWFPSSVVYPYFGIMWRWDAWASKVSGEIVASGSGWAWSRGGAEADRDAWLESVGSATFA